MMIDSRCSGATHENAIEPLKPAVTVRNKSSHIMIALLKRSGDFNANILVVDHTHEDQLHNSLRNTHKSGLTTASSTKLAEKRTTSELVTWARPGGRCVT